MLALRACLPDFKVRNLQSLTSKNGIKIGVRLSLAYDGTYPNPSRYVRYLLYVPDVAVSIPPTRVPERATIFWRQLA